MFTFTLYKFSWVPSCIYIYIYIYTNEKKIMREMWQ